MVALLLIPAAVEMERWSRGWAWGYAGVVCWWVANDTLMGHVLRRWHYLAQNGWEEMVICVVLLGSLWEWGRVEICATATTGQQQIPFGNDKQRDGKQGMTNKGLGSIGE